MLGYALRVFPLGTVTSVLVFQGLWLWLLDRWASSMWLTAGIAVSLLGFAVSRLLDEPAAALVDTLPRPLWWRTCARLLPAAALALVWCAGLAALDVGAVVRVDLLQLYGVGTVLLAAATCTALRRRGHAVPGYAVGSTIFLLFLYLALRNPVPQLLPLFPLLTDPEIVASQRWWTITTLAAAVVLAASSLEGLQIRHRTAPQPLLPHDS